MSILTQLAKEHHEVASIFKKIEGTSQNAFKQRQTLFNELSTLLFVHTVVEEDVFYAEIAADSKEKFDLLEAIEEHKLAQNILRQLAQLPCNDETWLPKLVVLRENVTHHVKEEEERLFKYAEKAFSKNRLKKLEEEFLSKKQHLLNHLEKAS